MKFFEKKAVHAAVLVLGAAFLLIDAFHGNIWFDESYSIGIAKNSFVDIWNIGAGDVHPVLFYWLLHIIYLLIGENWLAYRLFAVAGAVALGALGLTHVRRDFGEKPGIIFTFLALFTPYVSQMSAEIRMYTWVSFTVMLCAIYGYRIVAVLSNTPPLRIVTAAEKRKKKCAGVPVVWWAVFAVSSLASAYLQYYGALFVFMVNLILLIFLIVKRNKRAIIVFAMLAAVQVGLYVPWLVVAFGGQVGQVSGTYWARLSFPTTIIEIVTYPLLTSQMSFAMRGDQGTIIQVLTNVSYVLFAVLAACALIFWIKHVRSKSSEARHPAECDSAGYVIQSSFARNEQNAKNLTVTINKLQVESTTAEARPLRQHARPAEDAPAHVSEMTPHVILSERSESKDPDQQTVTCERQGAERDLSTPLAGARSAQDDVGHGFRNDIQQEDNPSTRKKGARATFRSVWQKARRKLKPTWARLKKWARRDEVSPYLGALAVYLGVLLIATAVSVFLQTDILYYRYLYVGIGPFLFCMAGVFAALKPRWITGALCVSVVFVAALNMMCLVHDDYDDQNKEPLRAFEEISQMTDLILSSDIGIMGVTAVTYPDVPQVYMDWQKGGWNTAYKAYEPAMTSVKKWEDALKDYHGQFAVIAQSSKGDVPRAVTDLDRKKNISVIDQYIYYRPYERTFFTIALLEKE